MSLSNQSPFFKENWATSAIKLTYLVYYFTLKTFCRFKHPLAFADKLNPKIKSCD